MDGETSDERRKRLKLLRERAGLASEPAPSPTVEESKEIEIRFRNYIPVDDSLKAARVVTPTVIPDAKAELKAELSKELGDETLLNVAPKKPNWDLKREVEKKIDKLNRKTQRAIVEIIRKRLEDERQAGDDGVEDGGSAGEDAASNE